jgi:hypothetical protein
LDYISADTIERALEGAGTKEVNKKWNATLSTIEMLNLIEKNKSGFFFKLKNLINA